MSKSRLPAGIWALGMVSLLMDFSSEMIHGLLPLFLTGVIGLGAISVGLIEGLAEATASLVKLYSGALSDRLGKRKALALAGYALSALTKPMFPLADSALTVLTARFIDRIGKGIRGAPRDALVADLTAPDQRGAAFGLRQGLDTVGAVLGPLVAVTLMMLTGNDFRLVFWVATVPAVLAVAVLALAVREPKLARPGTARPGTVSTVPLAPLRSRLAGLDRSFTTTVGLAAVLTLARFSEAFLILRAGESGLALAWVPLVMVVMSLTYTASAYPLGRLSDRLGRQGLLAVGCAILVAADVVLAIATTPWLVFAGAALWGLHMGCTQGLLSALVADAAPANARGTAFGVFHLVTGVAAFVSSVIAGVTWQYYGAPVPFMIGAALAAAALAGFVIKIRR
ncbi:MFS transporter [uncultured Gammaproteobacteria bacterium]